MLFILAWLFWLYRNHADDDDEDRRGGSLNAIDQTEMQQPIKTAEDDIHSKVDGELMSDNSVFYRHCYGSALPIMSRVTNGFDKSRESIQPINEKLLEMAPLRNGFERLNDMIFPDNYSLVSTDNGRRKLVQDEPIVPLIRNTCEKSAPTFTLDDIRHFDANDVNNTTLTVTTQTHVNSNLSISLTQPHRHTQLSVNVVDTMVTSPSSSPTRKHYKSEIKLIPSPTFRRRSINFAAEEDDEVASIFRPSDEVNESDMRYTTRHGVNVCVEAERIGRIHSIVVRPEGSPIRSLHQESDDDYDENQVRLVVEKKKPQGKIQAINVSTGHHEMGDGDDVEIVEDEFYASEEEFENAIPEFNEDEYFSDDVILDVEQSNDFGKESDVSIEEENGNKNPFAQYIEGSKEEMFNEEKRPVSPVPPKQKTASSEDDEAKGKQKNESNLFNKLKSLQKPKESESSEETKRKVLVSNVKTVKKDSETINPKKENKTPTTRSSEPVGKSQLEVTKPSSHETVVQKPKESLVKQRPQKPSFTVEQKSDSEDFMSIMKRRKKYVDTMDDAGRLLGEIANRDVKVLGRPALSKNWKLIKECVRTRRYLLFKDKPMKLAEPYRGQFVPTSNKNLYGKYRI